MAAFPPWGSRGSRARGNASRTIAGRLLVHASAEAAVDVADLVDPASSGLVVAAKKLVDTARQLRDEHGFSGVLILDPQAYTEYWATPDQPFRELPDRLFGGSTAEQIQEQIDAGADAAMTPTGCIRAGDAASLRAALEQATALEREDVIVTVPLEAGWLQGGKADIAVDMLSRVDLPKAVLIAAQFNPPEQVTPAHESVLNERRLAAEPSATALFRRDLAALDAVAHGALAGSVGTSGDLRHIIPPGQKRFFKPPRKGEPPDQSPNILVPDLRAYLRGSTIAERFREAAAPACSCAVCGGRRLSTFSGRADWTAARRHDVTTWSEWLPNIAGQQAPTDRAQYWTGLCRHGIANHEVYDNLAGRPGTFRPPLPLTIWSRPGTATVPHRP